MSRGGVVVDRVVACPGIGSGQAVERLVAVVAADGEYHAVRVASDRVQFARTFRPTWATIVGWCTLPLALIGVLFFFVKTTEACVAVVEADHRGTRIRLSGRLDAAVLEQLLRSFDDPAGVSRDAAEAKAIGAPVASVNIGFAQPSTPAGAPPKRHTFSSARPLVTAIDESNSTILAPGRHVPRISGFQATLDDGTVVVLGDPALLGRDPDPGPDEQRVECVTVWDAERSVSKTHLRLEVRSLKVLATDLYSTNGSTVVDADGHEQVLPPGVPTEVMPGSIVKFGSRSVRVSTVETSAQASS